MFCCRVGFLYFFREIWGGGGGCANATVCSCLHKLTSERGTPAGNMFAKCGYCYATVVIIY